MCRQVEDDLALTPANVTVAMGISYVSFIRLSIFTYADDAHRTYAPGDEVQSFNGFALLHNGCSKRQLHLDEAHLHQLLEARAPVTKQRAPADEVCPLLVFFLLLRLLMT